MPMDLVSARRSSEIHKLDFGNMNFYSEELSKLTKSKQVVQIAISIEFEKFKGNEKLNMYNDVP